MSGYNRIEQIVGDALNRFPRMKDAVETTYQRLNYHLLADRDFTSEIHDNATLEPVESSFDTKTGSGRFVGFYDVQPWSTEMDAYFVHEVDGDEALIQVISEETVKDVAETGAWNYQQGSRTHWHPTIENRLLYNDIEDGSAVARDVDLNSGEKNSLPRPIQAVDPTGEGYLAVDYRRLDRNDPAYGYGEDGKIPSDDGIYEVDFDGGVELLLPTTSLIEVSPADVPQENHYIHHVRYSPDGSRFTFLHRWRENSHRHTRLLVSDLSGNWVELSTNPQLSHFCWIDDQRLFLWGATELQGRGYFLVDVEDGTFTPVEALAEFGDGHPSISPDRRWIVTDTYPNRRRRRSLTLYNLESEQIIQLGEFHSPFGLDGTNRCDLHPRWSPDGQLISIDSTHEGVRRSYALDVGDLIS